MIGWVRNLGSMQDSFYNFSLSEAARRDSEKDGGRVSLRVSYDCLPLIRHALLQGIYTAPGNDADKKHESVETLPRILRNIKEYGSSFSERAQAIVQSLQAHPDLDCRFLGIRLSFSDFYKSKREHQQKA